MASRTLSDFALGVDEARWRRMASHPAVHIAVATRLSRPFWAAAVGDPAALTRALALVADLLSGPWIIAVTAARSLLNTAVGLPVLWLERLASAPVVTERLDLLTPHAAFAPYAVQDLLYRHASDRVRVALEEAKYSYTLLALPRRSMPTHGALENINEFLSSPRRAMELCGYKGGEEALEDATAVTRHRAVDAVLKLAVFVDAFGGGVLRVEKVEMPVPERRIDPLLRSKYVHIVGITRQRYSSSDINSESRVALALTEPAALLPYVLRELVDSQLQHFQLRQLELERGLDPWPLELEEVEQQQQLGQHQQELEQQHLLLQHQQLEQLQQLQQQQLQQQLLLQHQRQLQQRETQQQQQQLLRPDAAQQPRRLAEQEHVDARPPKRVKSERPDGAPRKRAARTIRGAQETAEGQAVRRRASAR
jgi:hypothetical protein